MRTRKAQSAAAQRKDARRSSIKHQAAVPATPDAAPPRGTPATAALRRGARQRRSTAGPQQDSPLPEELLQLVGGTLSLADLASASLVCRQWSHSLRAGLTSLATYLPPDAASNKDKAGALATGLPHMAHLHAHFGARTDATALSAFLSGVSGMGRLRELRLTSWVPYAPQKGAGPLGGVGAMALGVVTSLLVDGAALSANEMLSLINGAASAPQLASLSVAPGSWPYWTQLDPFQVPAWLQPAQPGVNFTGTPRMPAASAATLIACKLPGLKHLAIAADAGNQGDFFLEVQRLTGLTALDLLAGQPISSKPLLLLAGLPELRELKLQPLFPSATDAMEDHSLLSLTQLRRLGIRLARRTAEPLCRDLAALTRRRAPAALVELELSKCTWSADAGACVAALTSLTRLRLERLECVRPARASASASRAAMSVDLAPLGALRGMRCFELVAATGSVAGVVQGLGKLWSAWAPSLEEVKVVDVSVPELDPWATLPALGVCAKLKALCLLLREPMAAEVGIVDFAALPAGLASLALRNVVLTGSEAAAGRMAHLSSVSLRQCIVVPPDGLPDNPLHSGAMQPLGGVYHAAPLLGALRALRSLELVSMRDLRDVDFRAIGQMTALTSLLVCASGNVQVTHAALQLLAGLTRLRQLRWHVGDVTDLLPDVAALKSLRSLVSLHLPSYLHGQFSRWSAYNALPPLCDVHVEMPLP